jgi:hypothetical protein
MGILEVVNPAISRWDSVINGLIFSGVVHGVVLLLWVAYRSVIVANEMVYGKMMPIPDVVHDVRAMAVLNGVDPECLAVCVSFQMGRERTDNTIGQLKSVASKYLEQHRKGWTETQKLKEVTHCIRLAMGYNGCESGFDTFWSRDPVFSGISVASRVAVGQLSGGKQLASH